MKKFIVKTIVSLMILVLVNLVLLLAIPKDRNHFLCEYEQKVALFKETPQPRVILIGGSNICYATDTKLLMDSLHCQVVNFGMYGGIGIRLPLEEGLQYVKKGDLVLVQMEYHNFFNGGNGGDIAFIAFMIATDWKYLGMLNVGQAWNVVRGAPQAAIGNLKRLVNYPFVGSWDTPEKNPKYVYTKSGFNEYGDEVSHFEYPSWEEISPDKDYSSLPVDQQFMTWLDKTLRLYEATGVRIIMVPPVCVESCFKSVYAPQISEELHRIGRDFVVEPSYMALDDSCAFNTGYHMNKAGAEQNTQHMLEILREALK